MKQVLRLICIVTICFLFTGLTHPAKAKKKYFYIGSSCVCAEKSADKKEKHYFISDVIHSEEHDHETLGGAFYNQMIIDHKWAIDARNGLVSAAYDTYDEAKSKRQKNLASYVNDNYKVHYVKW